MIQFMTPFTVHLPGDKSITHRAFIFAALAQGESCIHNVGEGEDLASTRHVLQQLGVQMMPIKKKSWLVKGMNGLEHFREPQKPLNCGNSGTTMRLMAGLLSGAPFSVTLVGDHSLQARPMKRLTVALAPFGRVIETNAQGKAPITVGGPLNHKQNAQTTSSKEEAKDIAERTQELIEIHTQSSSAQLKSAALLAGLSSPKAVRITENRLSRDHSERMLGSLWSRVPKLYLPAIKPKIKGFNFISPGDFSSASFWIAMSALSGSAAPSIIIPNLNLNPSRMGLFRIAQRMGMNLTAQVTEERLGEPVGTLIIAPLNKEQTLQGITLNEQEVLEALDELPIVALIASFAHGTTVVQGARELRVKESDRIEAMTQGLQKLGVDISSLPDGWKITGQPELTAEGKLNLESHGDHRIALCFMIAGIKAQTASLSIQDLSCVAISYPEFFSEYEQYFEHCHFNNPITSFEDNS